MSFFWTDELAERAKALWLGGKSASEIARAIRAPSRNAVIGKLARMGVTADGKRTSNKGAATRAARPAPASHPWRAAREPATPSAPAHPAPRPPAPATPAEPVHAGLDLSQARPWLERGAGCAWPVAGDGADTLACARPVERGGYCAAHAREMFKPSAPDADRKLAKMVLRYA